MRLSLSSAVLLSLVAGFVGAVGASSTSTFRAAAKNNKEKATEPSAPIVNDGLRRGHTIYISHRYVLEDGAVTAASKHRRLQKDEGDEPSNTTEPITTTPIRGGDRDANGCLPSAGYRWCPSLAACIRPFETDCPMSMSELLCGQSGGTVVQSQVCIGTGDFPRECTGSSIGIGTVEDESAVPTMMPREPTAKLRCPPWL